jgi:hypothetical protein
VRKLAFFGGRGDPFKKRILPDHAASPFFFLPPRFLSCREAATGVNVAFLRIGGGVYQSWARSAIIGIIVPKSRTTEKKVILLFSAVFRFSTAPRAGIFRGSNALRAHPPTLFAGVIFCGFTRTARSLFRDRSPPPRSSTFFGQQFVEHFPICRSSQLVRIGDKSVQNRCWPLNIQRSGRCPFMAT